MLVLDIVIVCKILQIWNLNLLISFLFRVLSLKISALEFNFWDFDFLIKY